MQKKDRRYSSEDVASIVRHGLTEKTEDTVSHEELLDIAGEFGLDAEEIDTAINTLDTEQRFERRLAKRKAGFRAHLNSFIGVNLLLFAINLVTPGPWWFQWPLMGWGIGLFFHYRGLTRQASRSRVT